MPIYEYECEKCKTIYEMFHSMNHVSSTKTFFCSNCKMDMEMKKIISMSSFRLEGRGWGKDGYVDTYEQAKDLI